MADALVSPTVAATTAAAAVALIGVSVKKVSRSRREDIVPLMGVMGAFVFAAQMINFSIPGTGSSGHVVGGVLLAAVLGPWAAFITLTSVLVIQCLVFADGGLLALGCNIINMATTSTLLAYAIAYRPISGSSRSPLRLILASVAASVLALEVGAVGVTIETELSGITALPVGTFLKYMLPIHLVIGLIEGLATGAVLSFLAKYRPDTLFIRDIEPSYTGSKKRKYVVMGVFAVVAILLTATFSVIASENPDGLEWSVEKVAGWTELSSKKLPTTMMPGYNSSLSGIIGAIMVITLLWGISTIIFRRTKKVSIKK